MMVGRVTEIRVFPVKAMRGAAQPEAAVTPCGLAGDRRWLVVDPAGRFVSQREVPAMALVRAANVAGGLVLSAARQTDFFVAFPAADTATVNVRVWGDTLQAMPAGEAADAWLSTALGLVCRLVFQHDPASRQVNPDYAAPGDVVSFADGFPVLLTSEASLAALNARLEAPVDMLRFRPNLVMQGAPAWVEYEWQRLRIGTAVFRVAKPCDRCVVTTIDPATGTRPVPEEPLRTLKQFPRDARGRVLFGQNLVPEVCGVVAVGDAVLVAEPSLLA